jgi:DNA-binding beta-propeller fold protein YncE
MEHRLIRPRLIAAFSAILFCGISARAQVVAGYTTLTPDPGSPVPAAAALFSYTNSDGVLVTQAGVGNSPLIQSGYIYVDQSGTLTGIALANPSAQDASISLILRDATGKLIDTQTLSLGAHQHTAMYVSDIFPNDTLSSSGSLAFNSTRPVSAITLRQSRNAEGEPVYTTIPVLDLNTPAGNSPIVFPHIAVGGGFTTQILLMNGGNQPMQGHIDFLDSNGQPLPVVINAATIESLNYTIPPQGTYRAELGGFGKVSDGYAVLTPDGATATPSGTIVFRVTSGTNVVTEAGVAPSPPTTAARIFVDYIGTQTGVALANPSDVPATVTLTLLDEFGFSLSTATQVLPPRSHLARFVHELFPISDGFTGLLDIRGSGPIASVALKLTVNRRNDLVITTLPIADLIRTAPAGLMVFPQVVIGGGFDTRLILINTNTAVGSTGQIAFYKSDGTPFVVPMAGQTGSAFGYRIVQGAGRQFYPGNSAQLAIIELIDDPISNQVTTELLINEGNTVHANFRMIDTNGSRRTDFDLVMVSQDTSVAGIADPSGIVHGGKAGFSTLVVTSGRVAATFTITVVAVNSGTTGFAVTGVAQDLAGRLYLAATNDDAILLSADLQHPPQVYAGIPQMPGLKNDLRLQSLFKNPAFLTLNQSDGSVYVADAANNVIRRISPGTAGTVETFAGTGSKGSQDGSSSTASFNSPQGVALDSKGYLWIADSGNNTVRKINLATRVVETIAGQAGTAGSTDGTGTAAKFNAPAGIAVETETAAEELAREQLGNPPPPTRVIVADSGNGTLRRVDESGRVQTIMTAATFGASAGERRRFIQPAAPVTFTAPSGIAADPFGNVFVSEPTTGRVKVILQNGQIAAASQTGTFQNPQGIAITKAGSLIVADGSHAAQQLRYGSPAISQISPTHIGYQGETQIVIDGANFGPDSIVLAAGVVLPSVVVNTSRITVQTPSGTAALPTGITTLTVQNRGGLAQTSLNVDAVSLEQLPVGYITTVAGGSTFIGDGGAGPSATLMPDGIALDQGGNVFVVDSINSRVRRIDAKTGLITTVAGNGRIDQFTGDGRLALIASLDSPHALAFDQSGNLLIGEYWHGRIRRVDGQGIISTIAGHASGAPYIGLGDNGPAIGADFNPGAIALDSAGNIFIADSGNRRIRRIDAVSKIITTVAGNGQATYAGDGGPATSASINFPVGVAVDKAGNIYISESNYGVNNRIRRVDAKTGIISTVVGTGGGGSCGDGIPALSCEVRSPEGLTLDSDGNLLFSENSNLHRVRRFSPSTGLITTVAGSGDPRFFGDGGTALQAGLGPAGTALDAAGNLFIVDNNSFPSNLRVRRVDGKTGIISTIAGSGGPQIVGDGGPATSATLFAPSAITLDTSQNLYVGTDEGYYSRVRKIDASTKVITTAVGCGQGGCPLQGVAASQVNEYGPYGLAFDRDGSMYVAQNGCCIQKVAAADHIVTTIAGGGPPADGIGDGGPATSAAMWPTAIALDQGSGRNYLYIADTRNGLAEGWSRVRRIDLNTGLITTVAGNGSPDLSGDNGPATAAGLSVVTDVAVDKSGNLFIVCAAYGGIGGRIRRVDAATGIITTVVGGGSSLDSNVSATNAHIEPYAVAFDAKGRLFFADNGYRNGVLMVDANNRVVPVAGGQFYSGNQGYSGDNGPAASATFQFLGGYGGPIIAFDATGNLFIADWGNGRVRAVHGPIP